MNTAGRCTPLPQEVRILKFPRRPGIPDNLGTSSDFPLIAPVALMIRFHPPAVGQPARTGFGMTVAAVPPAAPPQPLTPQAHTKRRSPGAVPPPPGVVVPQR